MGSSFFRSYDVVRSPPPGFLGLPGILLADLMPIAAAFDWRKQRRLWRKLQPS
jgi:hypothetical protein